MENSGIVANDLFYKIRSRFSGLKLGSETGEITIDPEQARFFDFDYTEGSKPIGHISISIAEPNSMKVYFSTGITEGMNTQQKDNWYKFLKELRQFARRRLLTFDTRDITKDSLDQRDYEFLSQNALKATTPVEESIMNESNLYGTKTQSFQKLLDTKLIIKHSKAVMDDATPGARSRNISALFVENQDGERFKYPFIHLSGARAMQRHVANGGYPYDDVGKSIINMSEQIAQLKSFSNYIVKNDLMNYDNNPIITKSLDTLGSLREQLSKLSKQKHYEAYKESFVAPTDIELPEDVAEDFKNRFTVKSFNEEISSVFPLLYKLMQEDEKGLAYNDIVAMTEKAVAEDNNEETKDQFDKFENWVMALGEESAILSQDEEAKAKAMQSLQKLVGDHFPAGTDGSNAIESLEGIIDDAGLFSEIKSVAKQDPDTCVRPLVKKWLEQNAPDVVGQLDFGDMTESDDDQTHDKKKSVKELAEFIHSFYDRNTNTFPKGPEGVCLMVGKKFGEQAERIARKFVERMAPHQEAGAEELEELARTRELAGIKTDEDYNAFAERDDLEELRNAIDNNVIVSVAFVKKDGTVRHMGIKKNLSSYVPSDRPKTDAQANVEQNNDIKKVVDINAYNKNLKELRSSGMEDDQAKAEAAKKSWRSINLKSVLGFMVRGKFLDLRDENNILDTYGEEVYNSLTPAMKSAMAQDQKTDESFSEPNVARTDETDALSSWKGRPRDPIPVTIKGKEYDVYVDWESYDDQLIINKAVVADGKDITKAANGPFFYDFEQAIRAQIERDRDYSEDSGDYVDNIYDDATPELEDIKRLSGIR